MKICSQCEAINADGAQFCCKCGAQLGASQHGVQKSGYQPQPQYQPQQRGGYQPQPQCQPQSQYPPTYATMGFGDAIKVCMKEKYASFEGRATRAEYWYFYLFSILVMLGTAIVSGILGAILSGGNEDVAAGIAVLMYSVICLGFVCPSISVLVRRLHDTGKSGWWCWISLIPYIGGIVIFIFTLLSSQEHDNEYGPYVRY